MQPRPGSPRVRLRVGRAGAGLDRPRHRILRAQPAAGFRAHGRRVPAGMVVDGCASRSTPSPTCRDTQVIVYSKWDRSPDIVEDQVTYPIVTACSGAPKVKAVRGFSDFGYSYVYVDFRGRHGSVLGAVAHAGVSRRRAPQPAAGRKDRRSGPMLRVWDGSFSTCWWIGRASTASRTCAPRRIGTCVTT